MDDETLLKNAARPRFTLSIKHSSSDTDLQFLPRNETRSPRLSKRRDVPLAAIAQANHMQRQAIRRNAAASSSSTDVDDEVSLDVAKARAVRDHIDIAHYLFKTLDQRAQRIALREATEDARRIHADATALARRRRAMRMRSSATNLPSNPENNSDSDSVGEFVAPQIDRTLTSEQELLSFAIQHTTDIMQLSQISMCVSPPRTPGNESPRSVDSYGDEFVDDEDTFDATPYLYVFSALQREPNLRLRKHAAEVCDYYKSVPYTNLEDFRSSVVEWLAYIDILRRVSFELWIKRYYCDSIWVAYTSSVETSRVHRGEEDARETNSIATYYGVPHMHKLSFSTKSDAESNLFFILYTETEHFSRVNDWTIEKAPRFANCFYCIPSAKTWLARARIRTVVPRAHSVGTTSKIS